MIGCPVAPAAIGMSAMNVVNDYVARPLFMTIRCSASLALRFIRFKRVSNVRSNCSEIYKNSYFASGLKKIKKYTKNTCRCLIRLKIRKIDKNDRAILAALTKDGRTTIRDIAAQIGMSSPSVTERILKLTDAGAIKGYTVVVNPHAFGLTISAYVRMSALPGKASKLKQMLIDTPEVVEADHVTGEDSFIAKLVVRDLLEFDTVIDRFVPYASTDTAIIQSSTVVRRLPKL